MIEGFGIFVAAIGGFLVGFDAVRNPSNRPSQKHSPSLPNRGRLNHVRTMGMKLQELGIQQSHLHEEQKELESLIDLKRGVQRLLHELLRHMQNPSSRKDVDALIPKVSKSLRNLLMLARNPTMPAQEAHEIVAHLRGTVGSLATSIDENQNLRNKEVAINQVNELLSRIVANNDRR